MVSKVFGIILLCCFAKAAFSQKQGGAPDLRRDGIVVYKFIRVEAPSQGKAAEELLKNLTLEKALRLLQDALKNYGQFILLVGADKDTPLEDCRWVRIKRLERHEALKIGDVYKAADDDVIDPPEKHLEDVLRLKPYIQRETPDLPTRPQPEPSGPKRRDQPKKTYRAAWPLWHAVLYFTSLLDQLARIENTNHAKPSAIRIKFF